MKRYGDLIGDGGSKILDQVAEHARRLQGRLAGVDHIVAVMSGKGGVGKTSVAVNLANALVMKGRSVGLIDADINGASVSHMTGTSGAIPRITEGGAIPAVTEAGVKVMAVDLFMNDPGAPVRWEAPTQQDAFTWRGMMEVTAIRELISDTAWDNLDLLLVDLPPGTERLPNLLDVLPQFSGALIVTIPSTLSQVVVRRSIRMATSILEAPVLGLIENFGPRTCPVCGSQDHLFPGEGVRRLAEEESIDFLGTIPFDPQLAVAADHGVNYLQQNGATQTGSAFRQLANAVEQRLNIG